MCLHANRLRTYSGSEEDPEAGLMEDPMGCIESTYRHFGMTLSDAAKSRMLAYLEGKPKGKFGKHQYEVDEKRSRERPLFARYQERYDVPDEM